MRSGYYEARAQVARALAHPVRLKIIDLLTERGDLCVNELTDLLDISQSGVSKHLALLKGVGLVAVRKEGLQSFYHVRTPCVTGFFRCLDRILEEDLERRREGLLGKESGAGED